MQHVEIPFGGDQLVLDLPDSVDILVAGEGCSGAAEAAAKVAGVGKVDLVGESRREVKIDIAPEKLDALVGCEEITGRVKITCHACEDLAGLEALRGMPEAGPVILAGAHVFGPTGDLAGRIAGMEAAGCGLLFCAVAMLVFSPWMIRNAIWTGNPIYPLYNRYF